MRRSSSSHRPPPLSRSTLEALALRYVGRYATTRARLRDYLLRKLAERADPDVPAVIAAGDVEAVVEKLAGLGYVDDRAWAAARGAALGRRGYGGRRVTQDLRAAGIAPEDGAEAGAAAADGALRAALALARRRRIGPYAAEPPDREARAKAMAVLMRAGHDPALARRVAAAAPGEELDDDG